MAFAHAVGFVNTLVLLTLFYVFVLGTARLVTLVLRKDLLKKRMSPADSYWMKKDQIHHTLDAARHQF